MKIMATCLSCGRDFQLDQLIEGPVITGRCPWCEEVLAPQYTALLPQVIRRAEQGGSELESALRMLGGSWARFQIKPESVLDPLREELDDAAEESRQRSSLLGRLREAVADPGAAAVGALGLDLRRASSQAADRDRGAAREAEEAAELLVASAEEAGADAAAVRDDVARLSKAEGGETETHARLSAAADGLARTDAEESREALERVRVALREAEEALARLAG